MAVGNSTGCWIRISGADWTFLYEPGFWQNFTGTSSGNLYTKIVANKLSFLTVTHTACLYIRFDRYGLAVRIQCWTDFWPDWYTGTWSGFWATRRVKLAGVSLQDLKITCSAFQHLLIHTFMMPTTTVMAISVQPRAELVVCWKIGLSNGWSLWYDYEQQ
jgi:hypothetical protein